MSWAAWNFLITRSSPKVIVTSITWPNLRDNLWAEMGKWYARSPLLQHLFRFGANRITNRQEPKTWFASARSWSRSADPDQQSLTLAGIHAENVLVICDEAGGYPDSVMAALEAALAVGTDLKIVIGGNPTHLSGPLFRACHKERGMWHVTRINADPDSPTRSSRVPRQWALEQIAKYGLESSYVQVNVFGQFPRGATDALIPLSLFDDAFVRYETPEGDLALTTEPRTMGVDIARKGNDESVICFREGDYLVGFESWHGQKTTESTGRIAAAAREFRPDTIYVDDIGVGGGVTDQLEEIPALKDKIVGVNVSEKARREPELHHNLRSEINLAMQERFRGRMIAINPEVRDTTTLALEGSNLKVKFTSAGRRILESKDDYIARTGSSRTTGTRPPSPTVTSRRPTAPSWWPTADGTPPASRPSRTRRARTPIVGLAGAAKDENGPDEDEAPAFPRRFLPPQPVRGQMIGLPLERSEPSGPRSRRTRARKGRRSAGRARPRRRPLARKAGQRPSP